MLGLSYRPSLCQSLEEIRFSQGREAAYHAMIREYLASCVLKLGEVRVSRADDMCVFLYSEMEKSVEIFMINDGVIVVLQKLQNS